MYVSPYGKPEGLAERLDKWASDLSKNTSYPWAGLGLIADLKLAAAALDGQGIASKSVDVSEAAFRDTQTAPSMEFDL